MEQLIWGTVKQRLVGICDEVHIYVVSIFSLLHTVTDLVNGVLKERSHVLFMTRNEKEVQNHAVAFCISIAPVAT